MSFHSALQHFSSFSALPTGFLGLSFLLVSCETPQDAIIDSIHQSPAIISASISPTVINTDSMNVGPIRLPEDILTITITASGKFNIPTNSRVRYAISFDQRSAPISEGELSPSGVATDSIFAGEISFQIQRAFIGNLMLELTAESKAGGFGTSFIQTIAIQRQNQAPVISNLQAPDTVRTSIQQSFLITVQANDPDGASDILSVTRQTPSNLVLTLNDAGTNGDAIAGDGIFSETVSLVPPPPPDAYSFQFRALDRSNVASNTINHTVVVIP